MCVVVGFVGYNSNIFVERGEAEGGKWKGTIRRHTIGHLLVLLPLKISVRSDLIGHAT
jgi:hypothetical protein